MGCLLANGDRWERAIAKNLELARQVDGAEDVGTAETGLLRYRQYLAYPFPIKRYGL